MVLHLDRLKEGTWLHSFAWASVQKKSLNFLQKEKPTSSKDVSITISKQFEQWMRFKKGEDFFKD